MHSGPNCILVAEVRIQSQDCLSGHVQIQVFQGKIIKFGRAQIQIIQSKA